MKKSINKRKKISPLLKPPSYRRNLDNMKLLVSDPEFQEIIKETRKKLDVPRDSFGVDASEETMKNWHELLDKKSSEAAALLEGQRIKIDEKVKSGEIAPRMANEQARLLYLKLPCNYLAHVPRFIIEKFNLPLHYEYYINRYIIFGAIDAPRLNFEFALMDSEEMSKTIKFGYRSLPINIYTQLTDDELKQLKRVIKREGKKLPKYQPLKNIDRNLKIEEWYENKNVEKIDWASYKSYKIKNSEIAENLLGNRQKGKQIQDIVRDQKRIRDRRFRKNRETIGP